MEAVILAGGLGTRLKSIISDLPKPMAPIAEKPFIWYLLESLHRQQVSRVILATGYNHDCIESYVGKHYKDIYIDYSRETEPLGTGGALKKAFECISTNHVVILNGDTFFDVNLRKIMDAHLLSNADLTLCLKPMEKFDRYGVVVTVGSKIISFEEKKHQEYGNINGGVYIAKTDLFNNIALPLKFSFETDFMEKYISTLCFNAHIDNGYFIDIGIPIDYQKAQLEIPKMFAEEGS